jgi:feruloyl esterase
MRSGATDFDMLTELENWVEHNKPPRKVIAAHLVNGLPVRTHPLCPYPAVARWDSKGDRDKAESFVCKPVKG